MKALLLISLLATTVAFANTSTKTATAKKATNTKALTLQEIAEKAQNTSTLFEKENDSDKSVVLSIDNSGRLNNKDEALKLSAENNKTTTTKK